MSFDEFAQIISEKVHISTESIMEHSSFRDDLGIDSLQLVNLLTQLAEILEIDFYKLIQTEDISTVGGIFEAYKKGVVQR